EILRLFEIVDRVARAGRSHVVLTSSIRPLLPPPITELKPLRLDGIDDESVVKWPEYGEIDDSIVKSLHYALRGHAYALAVLRRALAKYPGDLTKKTRWLQDLVVRLSAVDLSRRAELAIDAAIQHIVATVKRARGENSAGCRPDT